MATMTIEEQITAELDATLRALSDARRVESERRREHDKASRAVSDYDARARNLRLALYRLTGEKGEAGDANTANAKRLNELARGGS